MLRGISLARLASAGLAAAIAAGLAALGTAAPAAAVQPSPFVRSFPAPAQSRSFASTPTVWNGGGAMWGVGPDTMTFKTFELPAPARGITRDIAVGHDGNLWISADCTGTIVRLTPVGVATAFTYGTPNNCNESPTSLALGPDGDVWFVDQFADLVGKISTRGKITTYQLPTASPCNYYPSEPLGIVQGADGAMWFSVTYPGNPFCQGQPGLAPAIGRITTTGSMTFFYTAPPGTVHTTSPERLTLGPNGIVYFIAAEDQASPNLALGAITTGGLMSFSSAFGTAANFNDYLTVGPDGNLWMTDKFDGVIDRIASGGGVSSFIVPAYHGLQQQAYGIAAGPDGTSLWFTTFDDNEIGRITTAGKISYHAEPSCSPNNCGSGGGIVRRGGSMWHTLPGDRGVEDVVKDSNLP